MTPGIPDAACRFVKRRRLFHSGLSARREYSKIDMYTGRCPIGFLLCDEKPGPLEPGLKKILLRGMRMNTERTPDFSGTRSRGPMRSEDSGRKMIEHDVTINGIEVAASYTVKAANDIFLPLLRKLSELQTRKAERLLVLLAAPPGAGKSTLLSFLNRLSVGQAGLVPIQAIGMDGFHRRQEYLQTHFVERDGKRLPMVEIKGAPITFDLDKLTEAVKQVSKGIICGWPTYNRLLHNPTENALTVDGNIVLLEGNYLLLDEDGWRDLRSYADFTISVRAPEELLRQRLIDRRIKTGTAREPAAQFVDFSDMPNVRLCLEKTLPANLELDLDADGDYHISSGGSH